MAHTRKASRYALFTAVPAIGHINPMLQEALELKRRGWRVALAATEELRSHVENSAPDVAFVSLGLVPDDLKNKLEDGARYASAEPNFVKALVKSSLSLIDALWFHYFDALVDSIRKDRPDVMVVDFMTTAGLDAAEAEGIPFIVNNADLLTVLPHPLLPPAYGNPRVLSGVSIHAIGPVRRLLNHLIIPATNFASDLFMAKLDEKLNACRRSRGLPPTKFSERLKDKLVLINSAFGLEYERPLSPLLRMVGPMLADDVEPLPSEYQEWLGNGSPVVYVNLGTVGSSPSEQLARMVTAFENLEYRVLWVLRNEQHAALPRKRPKNLRLEKWGPAPRAILGHSNVKCFVSHCGTNSVHESLTAGTPIVGIPTLAAQLDMGMRVQDAGVGLVLNKTRFTPTELRDAVERVMRDESFRRNIPHIQSSLRQAGGFRRAADLIEQFAGGTGINLANASQSARP
ncbi:MAG TPA: glycosyltransferase [Terriglobia bacterium]|nr:glycosyltransferase [Terriglobia bacterium]